MYTPDEVPIAILTGSRVPNVAALKATYYVCDVMQKPIDSLDLVDWLNSLEPLLPRQNEGLGTSSTEVLR